MTIIQTKSTLNINVHRTWSLITIGTYAEPIVFFNELHLHPINNFIFHEQEVVRHEQFTQRKALSSAGATPLSGKSQTKFLRVSLAGQYK